MSPIWRGVVISDRRWTVTGTDRREGGSLMPTAERIGILGGSFDPVHHGHLIAAQCACEQLPCDRLLLVPNNHSPLKQTPPHASFDHRLAMLRLAVEHSPALKVSDIEGQRTGPSFTVDTLDALHERMPRAELLLVLGDDALADFPSWKDSARVRKLARIAGMTRMGEGDALARHADLTVAMPRVDISSTIIRERIASGLSIDFLTPPVVAAYIRLHCLYRSSQD